MGQWTRLDKFQVAQFEYLKLLKLQNDSYNLLKSLNDIFSPQSSEWYNKEGLLIRMLFGLKDESAVHLRFPTKVKNGQKIFH